MRAVVRLVLVSACLIVIPAAAYAQASITGVVRDSSGAVMPGVTVEAASAALIEKVRAVVTDDSGQYRIITLPPGAYTVTFTLPGFSTVRREGIELTGTFTAAVNADLRVGSLEETITVTGESPLVDVQSATQQRVIDSDIVETIPSGRMPANLIALIPGITIANGGGNYFGLGAHDVGGSMGDMHSVFSIHGGQIQDSRQTINGLPTGWGNEPFQTHYTVNSSAVQEVVVNTAASAESEVGGVSSNIVPRDGGNVFSGTFFGGFTNENLTADNLTDSLKARGLATANSVKKNLDVNPGFGGPFKKDSIWFYTAVRYLRADAYAAGIFVDKTQDVPNVWAYTPDTSQKAFNSGQWYDAQMRVTWQATPRNKLAGSYAEQTSCACPSLISQTQPNGTENRHGHPLRLTQGDWTAPVTNRLLFDGGVLYHLDHSGFFPRDTSPIGLIGFLEQSTGANVKTRGGGYANRKVQTIRYRFSAAYVTGTHAFKLGVVNSWAMADYLNFDLFPDRYRLNNGVPNQVIMRVRPYRDLWTLDAEPGVFAQDTWTMERLTLNLGVRYDGKWSHFPEQILGDPTNVYGGSKYIPMPFTVPETPQLRWHDITPKSAATYDLFGNGRTALKVSLNKYLFGQQIDGLGNPVASGLVLQTTRNWNDANRNFIPDCDLSNVAANGECAAMADPNFGKAVAGTAWDPELLRGWGVRGYNWEFSTGVQHQMSSGVAVDLGYFRRWYGNLTTTDDRTLTAADFDAFSITAPVDPRLPGGGGYTISGISNLKPTSFGRASSNYVTSTNAFGKQISHWNGVDLSVNARIRDGVMLQGGMSTGRTSTDNCEIVAKIPELSATTPLDHCHIDTKFLTQVKFLGSYTIPKVDVQLSGSFQSIPGPQILANYTATNAQVTPSLGRPLSGGAANVTVNIVTPGTMYGERLNQIDLRFGKRLQLSGTQRVSLNVDLYNVLNASPVLQQSNTYGNWQTPSGILVGRDVKFSVQYNF